MVFNSFEFVVFAIVAFAGYAILRGRSLRVWLAVLSYIFYGWANPWYVILLLSSTVLDFFVGQKMHASSSQATRKKLLALSVAGNIGLLGVFKYSAFFIRTLNDVSSLAGFSFAMQPPEILLPVGISFYTFQTLSYTIDIYRGKLQPTRSFTTFALYVAFFPQLVAGPIERATHLLHQLKEKQPRSEDDILVGMSRVLWGLTKKVAFADRLGGYVAPVYRNPGAATSLEIVLATWAFAFQIYLDFSAYSDIAIGLARLMGIRLRENFRWPYLSRNISEFWQRWHISLSTWLRDYLYIPLGGSRRGPSRTVVNLVVVMFLGGLWHGADVKFIVWGLWLGAALGVYHTYSRLAGKEFHLEDRVRWRDLPGVLVTFHVVLVSWVFFRAASMGEAWTLLRRIVVDGGWRRLQVLDGESAVAAAAVIGVVFLLHILRGLGIGQRLSSVRRPVLVGIFWGLLVVFMVIFQAPTGARFIYFRF